MTPDTGTDSDGKRLGPYRLAPGIGPRNALTLFFVSFSIIGLVTWPTFANPYLFALLGIPAGSQGELASLLVLRTFYAAGSTAATVMMSASLADELLLASDRHGTTYRSKVQEAERRGYAIDHRAMAREDDYARAIPCPRRQEDPSNWVLRPVLMRPAGQNCGNYGDSSLNSASEAGVPPLAGIE